MGLYQGYIEFAIGLFLLCLLRDCLTTELPWTDYLRQGFTAVAALLLGGVLYAVSMKAVLAYKHLELIDSYNGLQQMGRARGGGLPGPPARRVQTGIYHPAGV